MTYTGKNHRLCKDHVTNNQAITFASTCITPTQDTPLSYIYFISNPQIMSCLKGQWWAFGPQLRAFGPILHSSGLRMTFEDCQKPILIFSEDLTSFGWDIRIVYIPKIPFIFSCAVHAHSHVQAPWTSGLPRVTTRNLSWYNLTDIWLFKQNLTDVHTHAHSINQQNCQI